MTGAATAQTAETTTATRLSDYLQLTKPRLSSLVLLTMAVGYLMAGPADPRLAVLATALVGMVLVVGGANALNQYAERRVDAVMARTRGRPLPAGRMLPPQALTFGIVISVLGAAWLFWLVNAVACALAVGAWISYVVVYTPLKLRTGWSTLVGAIPGAMPPVVGWAAASGTVGAEAWSLFAIIFFWQIPHFYAISSLYREQYARAGFPMLAVLDTEGHKTARRSLAYSVVLLAVSALPWWYGIAGNVYLVGGSVLGMALVGVVVRWVLAPRDPGAQKAAFVATLIYLTLLMGLLVFNRTPGG